MSCSKLSISVSVPSSSNACAGKFAGKYKLIPVVSPTIRAALQGVNRVQARLQFTEVSSQAMTQ
jgi:hypothetical protein